MHHKQNRPNVHKLSPDSPECEFCRRRIIISVRALPVPKIASSSFDFMSSRFLSVFWEYGAPGVGFFPW